MGACISCQASTVIAPPRKSDIPSSIPRKVSLVPRLLHCTCGFLGRLSPPFKDRISPMPFLLASDMSPLTRHLATYRSRLQVLHAPYRREVGRYSTTAELFLQATSVLLDPSLWTRATAATQMRTSNSTTILLDPCPSRPSRAAWRLPS